MNLILSIPQESELLKAIQLKGFLYFVLLTSVKVERAVLWSEYELSDLVAKMSQEEEIVEDALQVLVDEGYVEITRRRIKVGYVTDGVKKLFTPKSNISTEAEFKKLRELSADYLDATISSAKKSAAKILIDTVGSYEGKPVETYTVRDFVLIFGMAYEAVFQQDHREFMEKEFGQMKTLVKLYNNSVLLKMVLTYTIYFERWGKTPTIASLLYNKDEIFSFITDNSKKKSKEVHEKGF